MQPPDPNRPQKPKPPVAETLGATSGPIKIGKAPVVTQFEIHAPTGPGLLRTEGPPKRMLLKVENVTSRTLAPEVNVLINLPPVEASDKPSDVFALQITTFGMVEASKTRGDHVGEGMSFVDDITDTYLRLTSSRKWDGKTLRLTFVPGQSAYPIDMTVGRVSLVIE